MPLTACGLRCAACSLHLRCVGPRLSLNAEKPSLGNLERAPPQPAVLHRRSHFSFFSRMDALLKAAAEAEKQPTADLDKQRKREVLEQQRSDRAAEIAARQAFLHAGLPAVNVDDDDAARATRLALHKARLQFYLDRAHAAQVAMHKQQPSGAARTAAAEEEADVPVGEEAISAIGAKPQSPLQPALLQAPVASRATGGACRQQQQQQQQQLGVSACAVNFSMHGCVPTAAAGTYGSRFTTYSQLAHSKQLHKPAGAAAAVAPAGGAPTMAPASQHIAPHAGKRSQPEERGEQVVELRRKLSGSPTVVQYPPRGLATTKRKVGAYSRSPKPLTWRSCVVLQ